MSEPGMNPAGLGTGRRPFLRPHACFACGELNVHGLHLQLHIGDARCTTELTLEDRFQGWDGIAHGGIVSTILDELMAWALLDLDSWGLTARLSVEFKRPVPIGRRLQGEGWIVDRRRRLTHTRARLLDAESGEILAEAEATYVDAPPAERERLRRNYELDPGNEVSGVVAGAPAAGTAPAGRRPDGTNAADSSPR